MPNVRAYDPAFAYETAVIVRDGIRRMFVENQDVFYYLTLYNENYPMPPMPPASRTGSCSVLPFPEGRGGPQTRDPPCSGPILMQVLRTQELLQEKYDVAADVYSVTSYQLLRNEALEVERWNRLHPTETAKVPYVVQVLGGATPIIAASDFMKAVPDQISRWMSQPFVPLGTDGFGRSDTREAYAVTSRSMPRASRPHRSTLWRCASSTRPRTSRRRSRTWGSIRTSRSRARPSRAYARVSGRVPDAMWLPVGAVLLAHELLIVVVALEPAHAAVAFEVEQVRRDGSRNQRSWLITTTTDPRSRGSPPPALGGVYIEVVRWLVEHSTFAPDLSIFARCTRLRSPPERSPTRFC